VTDFYSASEALPPEERAQYQSAWLGRLVDHAYANAPATRRRMDGAGTRPADVKSLADLQRIPITRKDDLIELQRADPPFGGFLGTKPERLRRMFQSPGPILDPQGPEPDYWRFAPALFAAGLRAGDVVLCSVSYHLTPLGFMFDDALAELGCPVLPGGVGNAEAQLELVRASHASGYVGTPSFLNILLEQAEEPGLTADDGLRLKTAFVAGEMLPESLRSAIQERGVSVCQGYGTADLGCLAYECREKRGMHVPESAILEIVDSASGQSVAHGEPGEVVATVDRHTYPLLRFGTGDLSALDDSPCACGRTSPRLVRIMGRVGDAVKVRGMFVHPRQVDEVLGRFPEVQHCQLVVTRAYHRDELTIRLEASAPSTQLAERVASSMRELLKVRGEVEFTPSGTIPPDAKRIVDQREWD
jgi:phenylacetate-CoA ligase